MNHTGYNKARGGWCVCREGRVGVARGEVREGGKHFPSHKGQRVHWSMAPLTKLCVLDVRGSNDSWQLCLSIAGDCLMRPSQLWRAHVHPQRAHKQKPTVLYTENKDWARFVIRISVSWGIMGNTTTKKTLCYLFDCCHLSSSSSTLLVSSQATC